MKIGSESNFTCEIIKIAMTTFQMSQGQDGIMGDVRIINTRIDYTFKCFTSFLMLSSTPLTDSFTSSKAPKK